ncbi:MULTISPECIES: SMP-30/gluconolactonase/LRE family protein [unclassified Mycobacterium]|uniref:SMP-30/gluconolactonase/LRE family protein n=1 Tax=unclassified Mycobacterium TaxID=2642494 RepID=UPI000895F554|nr:MULTISPECIES: SMP-30/gluconolactonase/LRE family protein [unclassified Mycobacterium]SEB09262.1 40-residue YVTN family beta-propeller repeat-containing protein [Mycobacterium sp. 283mftsu]
MSNATYVGRVGGLAVALGVGFAIASTPGTAWADDAANPGATSAPAQNAAPETAGTTKPAAKAGKNKRPPGKASSEKQRATKPAPTAADSPAKTQTTAKTVTGSTKKPTPRALKGDVETTSAPAPRAVAATAVATSAVTPSVTATPTGTSGAVSVMSAATLDSSASGGPVAPGFAPVAAVLAAWGTRTRIEAPTKPAAVTSTSQPVAATAAQPVVATAATAAQPVPTAATTNVPAPWLNYSKSISVGTNPGAEVVGGDGRLYVANTGSNTVSVINTTTGKRIDANPSWFSQDISVGTAPTALALSPDGTRLYVANSGSGTVSVINTVGYKRIDADPSTSSKDITVGTAPSALTVGGDGRLYVANKGSGTVSVVDPTTYSVTDTVGVGSQPTALAVGVGKVYVANQGSNTVSVIDTSTLGVTGIALGTAPTALAIGTGGELYVASQNGTLSTIDTATDTVLPGAIAVGPAPSSVAVSADGSIAYVANGNDTVSVINTATSAVVSTVRFDTDAAGGHAVAVVPSGAVYVTDATDRTVRVLVQPSLIATSVTKIGSVGVSGVGSTLLNNDGTRALVVTGPSPISTTSTTRVAVIDTATGKQVGSTVSIAGKPVVPTFSADGTRAVITAAGTTATQLAVIDLTTGKQTGTTLTLPGAVGVQLLAADGSRALTTTYGSGTTQVAVIDTLTGTQTGTTVSVTGNSLEAPVLTADRTRALITTSRPIWETPDTTRVAVLDTTTGTQLGTTVEIAGNELAPPVLNADGTRAAITNQIGDFASGYTTQATVIDVATGAQVGTTQGLQGEGISYGAPVFNAAGNRVVFLARTEGPVNTFTTRLAVLDAATGAPVGTGVVVDGDGARELSADRTRMVITATSTDPVTQVTTTKLATVDLATGNQIGDVTLPGTWHSLLMTPDGGRAVTIAGDNAGTHVAVINTLTGAQTGTTLNLAGEEFGSRLISVDGSRALITTSVYNGATSVNSERLTVLDTTTGAQIGNTVTLTGFLNGGVQYSADTGRAVAMTISSNFNTTGVPTSQVAVIDTTTGFQLGSTLTLKPDNGYLVLSGGGTRAVVSTGSQLVVINTANGTQVGSALTGVGSNPLLTADGSRALTTGISYNIWTRTYTTTARVLKIV